MKSILKSITENYKRVLNVFDTVNNMGHVDRILMFLVSSILSYKVKELSVMMDVSPSDKLQKEIDKYSEVSDFLREKSNVISDYELDSNSRKNVLMHMSNQFVGWKIDFTSKVIDQMKNDPNKSETVVRLESFNNNLKSWNEFVNEVGPESI